MTIPQNAERFSDGNLGFTSSSASVTGIVFGPCSLTPSTPVQFFTSADRLKAVCGDGPGVLTAELILNQAGIVGFGKASASVAGSNGAVTATPSGGPSLTLSGSALFDYSLVVTVVKGGSLGVGQFTVSLDGGLTVSEYLVIPSGGTYAIGGLTLTFALGTWVKDTVYTATCECASMNASDLTTAMGALDTFTQPYDFTYAVISDSTTAEGALLLAVAQQAKLDALTAAGFPARGIVGAAGTSAEDALATWATANATPRIMVPYGKTVRATTTARFGFGFPTTQAADSFAARAARVRVSTDLKRVKNGSLTEIVSNLHNERTASSGLDDVKISTLRDYSDEPGAVYITQGKLRSNSGSDLRLWPHGLLIDRVQKAVRKVLRQQIGREFRTFTNVVNGVSYPGVMDPRDALTVQSDVNQELSIQLLQPINAEGRPGLVQGVGYTISATHNFFATGIIMGTVRVVPNTYTEGTETDIGFAVNLDAEAA